MDETMNTQQDDLEIQGYEEVCDETFEELSNGKGDDEDE